MFDARLKNLLLLIALASPTASAANAQQESNDVQQPPAARCLAHPPRHVRAVGFAAGTAYSSHVQRTNHRQSVVIELGEVTDGGEKS